MSWSLPHGVKLASFWPGSPPDVEGRGMSGAVPGRMLGGNGSTKPSGGSKPRTSCGESRARARARERPGVPRGVPRGVREMRRPGGGRAASMVHAHEQKRQSKHENLLG